MRYQFYKKYTMQWEKWRIKEKIERGTFTAPPKLAPSGGNNKRLCKKINKKKVVFFICNFIVLLFFSILMSKFAARHGRNCSWEEITQWLPMRIIGSLVLAAWITWGGLGDELIDVFSSRKKRRKKV